MSKGNESYEAPTKERHEALYSTLKDIFWKSMEFEFKEGAILLVVLGWLLTAERAQDIIAGSVLVRAVSTVVILLLTTFHAIYVVRCFFRSARVRQQLQDLAYMPPDFYESMTFPKYFVVMFCGMHFVASLAVIIIVWRLPIIIGVD